MALALALPLPLPLTLTLALPGAPVLGDALYADAAAAALEARAYLRAAANPHPDPDRDPDPDPHQERAYLHAAALRLPASTALVSADDLDAISAGQIATSDGEMAISAGTHGHAGFV